MAVDPLTSILRQLPKAALIVIIGNPYTYAFHVGIEILKRSYLNFKWYIIVDDVVQRYKNILRQYEVVKDDIVFFRLSDGIRVLEDVLKSDGNLAYIIVNDDPSYIKDYRKVLMRRNPLAESAVIIQVDEELYKSMAYFADLIIKLGMIEDPNSFRTIYRVMKLILMRESTIDALLSYEVLPNGVIFREFTRV